MPALLLDRIPLGMSQKLFLADFVSRVKRLAVVHEGNAAGAAGDDAEGAFRELLGGSFVAALANEFDGGEGFERGGAAFLAEVEDELVAGPRGLEFKPVEMIGRAFIDAFET